MSCTKTLLALCLCGLSAASSASVIAASNTYTVGLSDARGGYSLFSGLRFDGRSHYLPRLGADNQAYVHVLIQEFEEDLGEGRHRLRLSLRNPHHTQGGRADLFPLDPSEGASPDLGIGVHFGSDPFDLAVPLRLDSLFLRMYRQGELLTERDVVTDYGAELRSRTPWDGGMFARYDGLGFGNGRGLGIDHVEWEFEVTELAHAVPAPASLALALVGLGLLAAGRTGRRHRR